MRCSAIMQGTVLYGPRDIRFEDRRSAQLAQAKAMLANAQAVQRRTELNVERYTPLVKDQPASEISTTRSKQSRRTGNDRDGQSANQDLRGSPQRKTVGRSSSLNSAPGRGLSGIIGAVVVAVSHPSFGLV